MKFAIFLGLVLSGFISSVSPVEDPFHTNQSGACNRFSLNASVVLETIEDIIRPMIQSSQFVYTYATIRDVVNEHDHQMRQGKPAKTKKRFGFIPGAEKPLVNFNTPALVVTKLGAQIVRHNFFLRHSVTADMIRKFLQLNRNLLKEPNGGGDISFQDDEEERAKPSSDFEPLTLEERMVELSRFDGELLEYDDRLSNKDGIVYGITINRTKKRITVIFRGTVGKGDIAADANFFHTVPDLFKQSKENIKVHSGFASYLFGEIEGEGRTKFDRIIAVIKEVHEELPESDRDSYDLYVSGHSLGGALCNLFAFAVAETQKDCRYFDKVTAVSFAAPVVGNRGYNNAFQALERNGRLRHLRISNQGDVVSTQPVPGYTQNGVNLFLYPHEEQQEMQLDYRNTKSLLSQVTMKALANHKFGEYHKRLFDNPKNKEILSRSMEEIYRIGGDFTN